MLARDLACDLEVWPAIWIAVRATFLPTQARAVVSLAVFLRLDLMIKYSNGLCLSDNNTAMRLS